MSASPSPKLAEMEGEVCIFKSYAPGLYEPYVDISSDHTSNETDLLNMAYSLSVFFFFERTMPSVLITGTLSNNAYVLHAFINHYGM